MAENRYRVTDTKGRGLEYRKRHDFSADALSAIDAAESQQVLLEGWLNRSGRWSISGTLAELGCSPGAEMEAKHLDGGE